MSNPARYLGFHPVPLVASGDFVALNMTGFPGSLAWRQMASDIYGNVYVTRYGYDIYMKPLGSGVFVAQIQGARSWSGIAAAPDGSVYASIGEGAGPIYKRTVVIGNFISQGGQSKSVRALCVAPNGDIYAAVEYDDIYKWAGGAFASQGAGNLRWCSLAADIDGNIYAGTMSGATPGNIYKRTGGEGAWDAMGAPALAWYGLAGAPNGDVYAAAYSREIFKRRLGSRN